MRSNCGNELAAKIISFFLNASSLSFWISLATICRYLSLNLARLVAEFAVKLPRELLVTEES